MQTFATFAGIETSEKKAAGPPGWFRRYMKPNIKRWNPRDTCTVEKRNMIMAMDNVNLFSGVFRL
jgi:hypothetical protein